MTIRYDNPSFAPQGFWINRSWLKILDWRYFRRPFVDVILDGKIVGATFVVSLFGFGMVIFHKNYGTKDKFSFRGNRERGWRPISNRGFGRVSVIESSRL